MKNLITYLKSLWSRVADSQRNDVSLDCRLTVVRPSFDRRSTMLKLVSVLVLMLTLGVGNAWGADVTYTFSSATNNPGNAEDWFSDAIDSYTSWSATKGGNNNPKYYNTGSGLRVYNGGTFAITSSKTISSIKLTFSAKTTTFSSSNTTNPQTVSPDATSYEWSVGQTCRLQKIEITYAASYTITVTRNNNSYGTVSLTGTTITATPADCYQVKSDAAGYSVTSGTATVSHSGTSNTLTVTPSSNCTVQVIFEAKGAGYTVNFDAGPGVSASSSLTETCRSSGVTLPTVTASGVCKGWSTFAGWATAVVNDSSTTSVTVYSAGSNYVPASDNMTLYAVYSKSKSGGTSTASSNAISSTSTSAVTLETGKPITYTCSNSNSYSNPARIYKGNKITIAGGTITGINLTGVTDYAVSNMTVNTGTLTTNGNNGSWSGSATSVVFTASSAQTRISAISVTYTGGSTIYYCSDPNCCNSLGSLNGSLSWSSSATGGTLDWSSEEMTHTDGVYVKRSYTGITGSDPYYDWVHISSGTTSVTFSDLACGGGTTYTWYWKRKGATDYCDDSTPQSNTFTTSSCACSSQYTYFWGTSITNDNPAASAYASHHFACFTTWNGTEGKTGLITLPNSDTENYWFVGYNGYYYNSNLPGGGRSWCTAIYDMNYANSQSDGKVLGWNSTSYPRGATGYIRIYSDNSTSNKYAAFIPSGYILRWKNNNDGDSWGSYPFTDTGANNYWETSIQQLGSGIGSSGDKVYVGLATSGMAEDYTWCGKSEEKNLIGIGKKTGASSWAANGIVAADAGQKGKWRIVITDNATNWNLHFVPYWEASYAPNGGGAVSTTVSNVGPVSCEGDATARQVTMPAAPTYAHHSFTGWSDGVNTYLAGATVSLTQNTTFTAQWSVLPQYTVTLNAGANGSLSVDKASSYSDELGTVTITITPNSGYQLGSITAVDASSNTVALSGTGNSRTFTMPASNVTVTATFVVRTDYVLVESALDDYSGEYLIAYRSSGTETLNVLSGRNGNKNAATYGTYTNVWSYYNSGEKAIESNATTDAMKMVVEPAATADRYTIYFASDETYLGCSAGAGTGGTLRFVENPGSYEHEWRFVWNTTDNVSEVSIWNNANSDPAWRWLLYNAQSPRFSLYTSGTDIELYKKVETCDKLAAPTGLTASSITQTTVTLSWNSVTSASGYEISLDNGSSWTSTSTSTSYNATGLSAGTTYNWKVRATGTGDYCAKGNAASSTVTMKNAVTVTYNANGGTGTLPVAGGVVNLTEGDSYTVLGNIGSGGGAVLTKDGYTWAGWHNSTTYSATPAYTVGGSITVNSNTILYANWAPKTDTYKDGVHNNSDKTGSGVYTAPTAFPDETRATSGNCETTHFKFIGWVEESDFNTNGSSATIIAPGTSMTATGATYYAVWGEEL